jgi:TRAP transporter TAXI family solute receptor
LQRSKQQDAAQPRPGCFFCILRVIQEWKVFGQGGNFMNKVMKRFLIAGISCFAGAALIAGCGGGDGGQGKQFLNIATGGTAGTYYPLGGAIAEILNQNIEGMNASAQSTGASVANVNMLKDNSVDIALIQNDIAYYAYNGKEMFEGKKVDTIRGLAALYPETIQFVTRADSGIKDISDLKGKKVAVGASGSGAEANARQILAAYGITYDDIDEQYLSFGEASDALKDGNIDCGVVVAGYPTAAIQDLASNKSAVVVNITPEVQDKLMADYPYYTKMVIPAGTYKGQDTDVNTVAVKCVLVTTDKLGDDMGGKIVKAIYEHLDRMKAAHSVGSYITKESALDGMSIPMNAGAEQYFKS